MENIDIIKKNDLYRNTFNVILKIGVQRFNINQSDFTIAFRPKIADIYDFELVFWLDENRISFNIEDWYEVLDDYITTEEEALKVFEFIDTIFQNKLIIEQYSKKNSNIITSKKLIFTSKINGLIKIVNLGKRIKFLLPWQKEILLKKDVFEAFY